MPKQPLEYYSCAYESHLLTRTSPCEALVLQALYNLSDDQAEYQLRDRLSFMRFLCLELEDTVPDAKDFVALSRGAGQGGRGGRAV